MIVHSKYLAVLVVIAILFAAGTVQAGENPDALVERGVAAFNAGDYETAKTILLPLAKGGNPEAMNVIGMMHFNTPAFPNEPEVECDWYERSATNGHAPGMYNLSICFNEGHGRPYDESKMLQWRLMAAQNGSVSAMINLAGLDPQEGAEYLRWMKMAQDHGSAYAKVDLWLVGYKTVSEMTFADFVCVSWNILLGDESFTACD